MVDNTPRLLRRQEDITKLRASNYHPLIQSFMTLDFGNIRIGYFKLLALKIHI